MLKVKYGVEMPPAEARQVVDELYQKVARRWEEKVNRTRFMVELQAGKLPLKVWQVFFRNWGAYTIEINTLVAGTITSTSLFLSGTAI